MSKLILPETINWIDLGHAEETFHAFSPDYEVTDIGKNFDLTVTLFGYQIGAEEVEKIVKALQHHLELDSIHTIYKAAMKPDLKLEDHACMTGDCPHEKQIECDEALKEFKK